MIDNKTYPNTPQKHPPRKASDYQYTSDGLDLSEKKVKPRKKYPGVGVGVFLIDLKNEKLLVGRRIGNNMVGLPGGWLEAFECWEDCAKRELAEEVGIDLDSKQFIHIYTLNCRVAERNIHVVSCIMCAILPEELLSSVTNPEPDKCEGWAWATVAELREMNEQLFHPLRLFFELFQEVQLASDIAKMTTL